jgi:hypothetical protein
MKAEPIDPKRLTPAQHAIYVAHRPDPLPPGMTPGDADAEVQRVLTREGIPWAPVPYTPIDPADLTPEQREIWEMLEMAEPPSSGTRAWADLQFCYILDVFYGIPLEPFPPGLVTETAPLPKSRGVDRTAETLARGETGIGLTGVAAPPGTFRPKP